MVKARKFVLVKIFDGLPKKGDLEIIEEELPPLKNGEFLAEAKFLSVDPYMWVYGQRLSIGSTMVGTQVAKIIESKCEKYQVGQYIVAQFGWRDYTISTSEPSIDVLGLPSLYLLPDFEGLNYSLALGALGMPGNTAYFGFLEFCKPKKGETVLVTVAAGAVGSLVGQIAKIKGCKVIGVAGSEEKGKWLLEELGFDGFINYKKSDFVRRLKSAAPEGIDCYFDNIGGEISSLVLRHMNKFGRIAVCGAISTYNATETNLAQIVQIPLIINELRMEGFVVSRWNGRWLEGINQMKQWIKEGKIKYKETITEGFEETFEAFRNMLLGGNFGKAVVKI